MVVALGTAHGAAAQEGAGQVSPFFFAAFQEGAVIYAGHGRKAHGVQEGQAHFRGLHHQGVYVFLPQASSLAHHGAGHEAKILFQVHQHPPGYGAVAGGKFKAPASPGSGNE